MGLRRAWVGVLPLLSGASPEDWMAENFGALERRSLLEITLPGSHNSGNYQGGLHADALCHSDYRYQEYLASASTRALQATGGTILNQQQFDQRMIPWQINHFHPIRAQLEQGVRFLHLKICNFNLPGSMDLAAVRFQHRGYTTRETVASTLEELKNFLRDRPRELVVLGFNNLHNNASKVFPPSDALALAEALELAIGQPMLISKQDLFTKSIGDLVAAGKRVAVFLPASSEFTISSDWLAENWSPDMTSGNLADASAWLVSDWMTAPSGRFYVMQANPNNAEAKMYESINSGKGSQSNLNFLEPFLADLYPLVLHASARGNPLRRPLNAVSSDFLAISRVYPLALTLNRLDEAGWWWLRIVMASLCLLLCICCYLHCRKSEREDV